MPFVLTAVMPPPTGKTITVRSGGSVMFAAKLGARWVHLWSGHEDEIPEPLEWLCHDEKVPAEAMARKNVVGPVKRKGQLALDFGDSERQSPVA